jgi:hypothetical protein
MDKVDFVLVGSEAVVESGGLSTFTSFGSPSEAYRNVGPSSQRRRKQPDGDNR